VVPENLDKKKKILLKNVKRITNRAFCLELKYSGVKYLILIIAIKNNFSQSDFL